MQERRYCCFHFFLSSVPWVRFAESKTHHHQKIKGVCSMRMYHTAHSLPCSSSSHLQLPVDGSFSLARLTHPKPRSKSSVHPPPGRLHGMVICDLCRPFSSLLSHLAISFTPQSSTIISLKMQDNSEVKLARECCKSAGTSPPFFHISPGSCVGNWKVLGVSLYSFYDL